MDLGPLAHRPFRYLLAARATSLLGSSMAPVGLAFAVLAATGSASDLGIALAAQTVPTVLLLLFGGVIGDRFRRDRILILSDLVCAATQAGTAALALTGNLTLAPLVALQALNGTASAFQYPAFTGLVPATLPAHQLQPGNALLGLTRSSTGLLGAPIAGLLTVSVGAGWALAVDALSYFVSALCLLAVRLPPNIERATGSMLRELREGWREFSSRTWLWAIVVQFSVLLGLGQASRLVLGPVVARESLGGAGAYGAYLSVTAAGAILAGVALLRVRFPRPILAGAIGMLVSALDLVLFATAGPLWGLLLAGFIVGVGHEVFGVTWETALQQHIPPHALSRVSAYDALGSLSMMPIGLVVVGGLSEAIGVQDALLIGVAGVVVPTLLVLCLPSVRGLRARPLAA